MMGDKIQAKKIAKENGLPVIEGSEGGIKDVSEAKELSKKIGFPVLIKASGGGGGKGMKIVQKEKEFETLFFVENKFQSDLVSLLSYYINIVYGLDKDSFVSINKLQIELHTSCHPD